jgi:hypothetical protein
MNRIFTFLFLFCFIGFINGQDLLTQSPENRKVVLEEFTGIHCGYCPEGHAIAKEIYESDPYNTVLINIHAGGYAVPSGSEPDFRTAYGDSFASAMGVTGYPSGTVNRHIYTTGQPIAQNRGSWSGQATQIRQLPSPVNLGLQSEFDETTRELTVTVELYYTEDNPIDNFLTVVFTENGYVGYQSDYTNGTQQNYTHNHILREILTAQWGDPIMQNTAGTAISKTYSYIVPAQYDIDNCDISAFVSENKKEVYTGQSVKANGGTTLITNTLTNTASSRNIISNEGAQNDLGFSIENGLAADETYTITVTSNAPADWTNEIMMDGQAVGSEVTVTSASVQELSFVVTPGTSSAIATYTLSVQSNTYPNSRPTTISYNVMSEVEDLIINNTEANSEFNYIYEAGVASSDITKMASASINVLNEFAAEADLSAIHSIYYNVGWTFPGLTNTAVETLSSFMDNGGNLLICGQDIGWDCFDAAGNGTAETKAFYNTYLHTNYVGDGSTSNTPVNPVAGDFLFEGIGSSSFNAIYGTNIYPEELSGTNGGIPVFKYGTGSKIGGIRAETDNYKVVYLGFGIEQLSNIEMANEIVKRSADWFHGKISTIHDITLQNITAYPIPAIETLNVNLSEINNDQVLVSINNMNGQEVYNVKTSDKSLSINTSNIPSGSYNLLVRNDKNDLIALKQIIIQ